MASSRAEELLTSAVVFREYQDPTLSIPETFKTTEDVKRHMQNVLMHDAHVALKDPLESSPDDPMFHTIDMDGDTPGIISSTQPKVRAHHIEKSGVQWRPEDVDDGDVVDEIKSMPAARARGPSLSKVEERALKRAQALAKRDMDHDAATVEKRQKREEARLARENETPEEREERLARNREKREEKKAQKALEAEAAHEADGGGSDNESVASSQASKKGKKTSGPMDVDCASIPAQHAVLPRRMRVVDMKKTSRLFANPVPNHRHMSALEYVGVGDAALRNALLHGAPCDRLSVVQGPPGTGKTAVLIDTICKSSFDRAFVCAHSNVAVVNLYQRLMLTDLADDVSLCIPPSRVPDNVVVASNDPNRRIVCGTISSRAGPRLHTTSFDAVFVDEAAQCSEACFWALIRPTVRRIVMAGDVRQLRAIAASKEAQQCNHDRSLMERLVGLKYPTTTLHEQRRMHPEICAFPSAAFYDGTLVTHASRKATTDIDVYNCIRVDGESELLGTSMFNTREIDACEEIVRREVQTFKDVVVICPYQAQCRAMLARETGVPVHTVDSFQGREADVVVLSVVRTGSECGFWDDPRRLVVALTRAKHRLYIVGSFDWTSKPLSTLNDDAVRRKCI